MRIEWFKIYKCSARNKTLYSEIGKNWLVKNDGPEIPALLHSTHLKQSFSFIFWFKNMFIHDGNTSKENCLLLEGCTIIPWTRHLKNLKTELHPPIHFNSICKKIEWFKIRLPYRAKLSEKPKKLVAPWRSPGHCTSSLNNASKNWPPLTLTARK